MEKYSYTPKGVCSRHSILKLKMELFKVLKPLEDAMVI